MKKSRIILISAVLVLVVAMLASCNISVSKDPAETKDTLMSGGGNNTYVNIDGASYSPSELYEEAKNYGYQGSFTDFIQEYYISGNGSLSEKNISRAMLSAVCVQAKFKITDLDFFYRPTTREATSWGSGVIYKLDKEKGNAYIITNYHVVFDGASESETGISDNISVFLYGQELTADGKGGIPCTYVGGSATYDIAVLQVENSDVLKQSAAREAPFADSNKVTVGQPAIAIGNPAAGGISATRGIISVDSEYITMRSMDGKSYVQFRVMRIDTAINSGNSGGGLFNENGEVIGIVNAKVASTSIESIAYAIPANVARYVADNIIENNGKVNKCLLGISLGVRDSRAVYDKDTQKVFIAETVFVDEINEGGLADGILEKGDVITSLQLHDQKVKVNRKYELLDLMLTCKTGDALTLEVERDGKTLSFTFTLTDECIKEIP